MFLRFTSRLRAIILKAEVDVTRKATMSILSLIGDNTGRAQGCALESWFYFLSFNLGIPVSAALQKTLYLRI